MFDAKKIEEKYGVGSKGAWLNLKEGENKMRIVSDFADYGNHFFPPNKSFICIGQENDCAYCKDGNKPSVQFVGYVIDRTDNQVKVLRIGYTIYKQISEFGKNEEYGFEGLPPYDITIVRKGQGKETEYTVIPARKNTELTSEEAEALMGIKNTPEQIIEKMKAKMGLGNEVMEAESDPEFKEAFGE